jgi:hypothetical protein
MGGRAAAGSTAVAADGDGRHVGCQRRRAAAGRAAGGSAQVARVERAAVDDVVGDFFGAEFRHVADADDNRARPTQTRDGECVTRCDEVPIEARALGDAASFDPDRVLDDDRYAGERQCFAGGEAVADGSGFGAWCSVIVVDDRVDEAVALADLIEEGLDDGHRVESAALDRGGDLRGGQPDGHPGK